MLSPAGDHFLRTDMSRGFNSRYLQIVVILSANGIMMKTLVKYVLQKLLGFRNYLFVFALFKTYTLKKDKKEGDFIHFLSMLPGDSTILDIGANIGVMTLHLAHRFPGSQVFSFEPVPENLITLRRLLKFFRIRNVTVLKTALGSYNGTADIIMPVHDRVRFHGLSHIEGVEGAEGDTGNKYSIPMKRLDDVQELKSISKPVSGIKLDVENYEFQVLSGAKGLLSKYKPLIYTELWDNRNRAGCMSLLKKLGYSVFVLDCGVLVKFESDKHRKQNFFFQVLPESKGD